MAAAAVKETTQLERLQAEFKGDEHAQREGRGGRKLTYLSIDTTIKRVNDVLGAEWSIIPPTKTELLPPTRPAEDGGKWFAKTEVFIEANIDGTLKTLYGVGASVGGDADDAAKTALAEAIKKAFHQAGVGLYLWDAIALERIEATMNTSTAAGRKRALKALAAEKLGISNPTIEQVAAVFQVEDSEDLKLDATVTTILTQEGVI
jgi:hypothetical protein